MLMENHWFQTQRKIGISIITIAKIRELLPIFMVMPLMEQGLLGQFQSLPQVGYMMVHKLLRALKTAVKRV